MVACCGSWCDVNGSSLSSAGSFGGDNVLLFLSHMCRFLGSAALCIEVIIPAEPVMTLAGES